MITAFTHKPMKIERARKKMQFQSLLNHQKLFKQIFSNHKDEMSKLLEARFAIIHENISKKTARYI